MSLPPWNVEDDGEGKRGDDIARKSCPGRVGPEAILSRATESLILILVIKMVAVHVGNDTDNDTELGDRGPVSDLGDKDGGGDDNDIDNDNLVSLDGDGDGDEDGG